MGLTQKLLTTCIFQFVTVEKTIKFEVLDWGGIPRVESAGEFVPEAVAVANLFSLKEMQKKVSGFAAMSV